jgi:hypothetical protein
MFCNVSASLVSRRILLACGLCLLAILFAVEAKTAWFGPVVGPGSAVRAAKALPADMPKLIEQGILVADPVHPQIPFALLTVAMIVLETNALIRAFRDVRRDYPSAFSAPCFSPHLFFRPPPVRS